MDKIEKVMTEKSPIASERESRTVSESYTEQVHIVTQSDVNGFHRLFGGQLMAWIDIVAAVVARRHSGSNVTTIFVDKLEFRAPARENDIIYMTGKMTFVGRTSMEVCVHTYVENMQRNRTLINKAYVTLVAIDDNDRPVEVPTLSLITDKEKSEWTAGMRRRKLRDERRNEKY